MGRVMGRRCDRQGCASLVEMTKDETPVGWIVVRPVLAGGDGGQLELCSNYCAYIVMRDRAEADGSVRRRGRPSANVLMGDHSDGKHDDDPRDGCPLCEAATAPAP